MRYTSRRREYLITQIRVLIRSLSILGRYGLPQPSFGALSDEDLEEIMGRLQRVMLDYLQKDRLLDDAIKGTFSTTVR